MEEIEKKEKHATCKAVTGVQDRALLSLAYQP
jgi:hypothetical protein